LVESKPLLPYRVCKQTAFDLCCGFDACDELQHHLLHQHSYQCRLTIKPEERRRIGVESER